MVRWLNGQMVIEKRWLNGQMVEWLDRYNEDMEKKYITLHDIRAYKIAAELSDFIHSIVSSWDWFNKRTLGVQLVDSADSIAGNIAEGFGRFHKKDKQKFYYNARGSVMESIHWIQRASTRKLLSEKECASILEKLEGLPREINYQIRLTEEKLRK